MSIRGERRDIAFWTRRTQHFLILTSDNNFRITPRIVLKLLTVITAQSHEGELQILIMCRHIFFLSLPVLKFHILRAFWKQSPFLLCWTPFWQQTPLFYCAGCHFDNKVLFSIILDAILTTNVLFSIVLDAILTTKSFFLLYWTPFWQQTSSFLLCWTPFWQQTLWNIITSTAVRNRRGQLKCNGTRAEIRLRLSAKRTSPFKSAGGSLSSVDYWQPRCAHQR